MGTTKGGAATAPGTAGGALSWLDMVPAEFDGRGVTRAERRIIAEAPDTLFPRLLPAPAPVAAVQPAQLPGQDDLFGGAL
jgi:hypothetical protein